MSKHERAVQTLEEGLKKVPRSWTEIVARGYLEGLAATEDKAVLDTLKKYTELGIDDQVRRQAVVLLAKVGKMHKKRLPTVKDEIEKLLHDRSYRVRVGAISAAKAYGDAALLPALSTIADTEVESTIVRYAREAVRALSKKKEPDAIGSLQKSVEELEKENRDLKDRIAKVEAMVEKDKK
jgi:hypothetical protein